MLDLSTISAETLTARGAYATVRGEHEDAKKRLQILCGSLAAVATQILRAMQPDNDVAPQDVSGLILVGKTHLDNIDTCVVEIGLLAIQRVDLKITAWGK